MRSEKDLVQALKETELLDHFRVNHWHFDDVFPPTFMSSVVFPCVSSSMRTMIRFVDDERGSLSVMRKGEKLLGINFLVQRKRPEYSAEMKLGANWASCMLMLPNWRVSSCSAFSENKTEGIVRVRLKDGIDQPWGW